jgi:hypothetical protein
MIKAEFEEKMAKWRVLRDKADKAYKQYQLLADEADCEDRYIQRMVEKEHQLYMKGEKV